MEPGEGEPTCVLQRLLRRAAEKAFREHLPAAAATSLCRLLQHFGADALSRAALAGCDAAPLALCLTLYQVRGNDDGHPLVVWGGLVWVGEGGGS